MDKSFWPFALDMKCFSTKLLEKWMNETSYSFENLKRGLLQLTDVDDTIWTLIN